MQRNNQWRRSQVKSGGINIEKIEEVGSGEGLCPPQLGSGGLPPEKKFALKLCNSEQVLLLFSYITAESSGGDYPPSPESGGPIPLPPPCSDAYGNNQAMKTGPVY